MEITLLHFIGVVLGSGALSAVITALLTRRKTDTEIESMVVSNYEKLVKSLSEQVDRLEKEMEVVRKQNRTLIVQNTKLLIALKKINIDPDDFN